jgi:hypothetical protein
MKKILIASGCSYTDPNFKSEFHPEMDCSWPMWPELLAEKLDMECINLGQSGQGQEYIFSSLTDTITAMTDYDRNRIGLIIPAWTRSQREDFEVDWINPKWKHKRWISNGDAYYCIRKTLRYWFQLQVFCELYNLTLKQVHMLNCLRFEDWEVPEWYRHSLPDTKKIYHAFISSPYVEKLKKETFIGWPNISNILSSPDWNSRKNSDLLCHRFALNSKVLNSGFIKGKDAHKINTRISELDLHPNKLGQEKIADYIYENL